MTVFFAILAAVALLLLGAYISKTRTLLRELEDAVHAERRLLLEQETVGLRHLGFPSLVNRYNILVSTVMWRFPVRKAVIRAKSKQSSARSKRQCSSLMLSASFSLPMSPRSGSSSTGAS